MATGFILVDNPPATAQGTFPRRGGNRLSGTCIVHTSEGAWQAGVDSLTRLVSTRSDYGCYHQACDWEDIAKYYPWEWEAWQDSETNNWAVGIAAACKTTDWRIMPADISEGYYRNMAAMAVDFINYMKNTYNITVPVRRITGAEARARVPGFCAHGDSGVSRSDPGVDFDWGRFFRYINDALSGKKEDDVGTVEKFTPEALEQLATAVMNKEVPWFGFDGKVPTQGRNTTTLRLQLGWLDAQSASLNRSVDEIKSILKNAKVDDKVIEEVRQKLAGLSVTLTATPEK